MPKADSIPDSTQLKDWFNAERYEWFSEVCRELCPGFDRTRFLRHVLDGLEQRELLQRLRRTTEALRLCLPGGYEEQLAVLRLLAPRVGHSFVGMVPCDFVGCHGLHDTRGSLAALAAFTEYGSGEFAVREFIRREPALCLEIMCGWARHPNEHVRRLASEGLRPRLPWSFRLEALVRDPSPVRPVLEALRADSSLYVRKSVANHLNDISKDHPDLMLSWLETWDLSVPETAWIARHACRTLIKAGNARALALFQVSTKPKVEVLRFAVSPRRLALGGVVDLQLSLVSQAKTRQRLIVDFALTFARASGRGGRKVFKWKNCELSPGEELVLNKKISFEPRSTRRIEPGKQDFELLVNGQPLAAASTTLTA